jgi:flagellar hook assembly protein FlgD
MGAGVYSLVWDGRNDAGQDVAGGVYLVSIQTGGRRQVQKLLVVR